MIETKLPHKNPPLINNLHTLADTLSSKLPVDECHQLVPWSTWLDALTPEDIKEYSTLFKIAKIPRKNYLAIRLKQYIMSFLVNSPNKEEMKKRLDVAIPLANEYIEGEKGKLEDGAILEALPIWEAILEWNGVTDPQHPIDTQSSLYQIAEKSKQVLLEQNPQTFENLLKQCLDNFNKDQSDDKMLTGKDLHKRADDYILSGGGAYL